MAIPGSIVAAGKLVTPGGAAGPVGGQGNVGPPGPNVVSADAGNIASLGSDNLILVPQQTLWYQRLRSFNAVGNPNFEVDQRNVGNALISPAAGTFAQDRWQVSKSGTSTLTFNTQQVSNNNVAVSVPGTSFSVTRAYQRITLTAQQASLGASDYLRILQLIEGPQLRELFYDVHSLGLIVRSSVAGLAFAVLIRDSPITRSMGMLCTIPTANTFTYIQLPNLSVFPTMGTGNFAIMPGSVGYELDIVLACGATLQAPAGTWQTGNFLGVPGMSNFAASPVNSTFDIAFVQHEPGAVCSTLMDKPFSQNLDECLRYYQKTYDYDVLPGAVSGIGQIGLTQVNTTLVSGPTRFHKPMAKIPTATAYNPNTGTNSLRLIGVATDYSVSGFNALGKAGFLGINVTGLPAPVAGATAQVHYTADTGW